MKLFFIFLLACGISTAFAENTEKTNQIYNAQSQLTVDNINQAVKILRNPTVMSGNFREALKNLAPNAANIPTPVTQPTDSEEKDMPVISLVAKVLAADKPASVMLRVNDHTVHLSEGSTVSQMVNQKIVNIRVDKITATEVTIFLSPFEQFMVLH